MFSRLGALSMESDVVDLAMEHVPFDGSVYDVDCSPCLDGFASSDTHVSGGQDTEKDTKSTSIAMAGRRQGCGTLPSKN